MAHDGNRKAAWTLVILAPVIAELGLGVTKPSLAFLVLLWLPIYGAGILLVRELVRRTGRGWPSVIVLGLAFELVEDGIGLQALSSPNLYGAADWGPRILGLNLPYWEANAIYHIIFSAIIPILFTDLLFPAHRNKPYLRKGGLVVTALVWILGVAVLRVSVPPTMDPGYSAPWAVLAGIVVAVAGLGFLALRVLPPATATSVETPGVPAVGVLWALGAVGIGLLLFLTFPLHGVKADGPAFSHGWLVLLPMGAAVGVCAAAYVVVRHWASAVAWTDRHSLALVGGALPAHTVCGMAIFWPMLNAFDVVGLGVVALASVVSVLWVDARLRSRAAAV